MRTTALYKKEPLPSTADLDVLIVMGGPMSIHDEMEYPWLLPEKELIGAAIREGKKVLGICLGAQLIAAVCGARVYPNSQKEIGFWPVRWVNPAFTVTGRKRSSTVSEGFEEMVFHWHGETFDLPVGAVLLASTEVCVNQAFSLGDRVLGIQFHPEVTAEIIRGMVAQEGWELVEGQHIQSAREILEGAEAAVGGGRAMEWLREWL
jgi:GMP synthase-like glutamine amidotransferase